MEEFLSNPLILLIIVMVTVISCFYAYIDIGFLIFRRWNPLPSVIPPSPTSLPILGHLHLITNTPHHSYTRLADKLGPIIFLRLGQIPTIIISSARLAKEILKTHDHVFASRPPIIAFHYLAFGCSSIAFSPYGNYWRQIRKISVTELLTTKRVKSFQFVREEEVNRLLRNVSSMAGSEIEMCQLLFSVANNVLCRVAFGKKFESETSRLTKILSGRQVLLAGFNIGDFYPCLKWINSVSGLRRRLLKNLNDMRAFCDDIIHEHLAKKTVENNEPDDVSGNKEEDVVDVLLRLKKDGHLEIPLTDDSMNALVLEMISAGTDTTSAALEWTVTELARHPKVMSKAQEEVRQVVGSKGNVDADDLTQLDYLKAVIKESLRLHPPAPLLVPRESMQKCNIDGYEIPAKTRVFINAYAIGRDPQSWDKPLEFNPQRFIDSNIDVKGQDFELLPFGGGRRGCPGYSFALATIEVTLSRLLYHFDWSLPQGVKAEDVDVSEIYGLATKRKFPLFLVPTINKEYEFKYADGLEASSKQQRRCWCDGGRPCAPIQPNFRKSYKIGRIE